MKPAKKKYRIVETEFCGRNKTWMIQKKSFLGFWYNPENVNGYITGYYDTLNEAIMEIERRIFPVKKTVVYEKSI